MNHIDYKYLQGYNDPWYCIPCCDGILSFGTLTNKNLLSLVNPPPALDNDIASLTTVMHISVKPVPYH